ncbi:hypothetical protein FG05_35001 [Fusarium graminearum]|nr:hypothetical protein FG05_35001 [Fusarium graminearum]
MSLMPPAVDLSDTEAYETKLANMGWSADVCVCVVRVLSQCYACLSACLFPAPATIRMSNISRA